MPPAWVGTTILDIDTMQFRSQKSHFSDFQTAQMKPILVMIFGPIALSFVPFPDYPFHASQAGPQKPSQIRILLLQVASLSEFKDVSVIILMTS